MSVWGLGAHDLDLRAHEIRDHVAPRSGTWCVEATGGWRESIAPDQVWEVVSITCGRSCLRPSFAQVRGFSEHPTSQPNQEVFSALRPLTSQNYL